MFDPMYYLDLIEKVATLAIMVGGVLVGKQSLDTNKAKEIEIQAKTVAATVGVTAQSVTEFADKHGLKPEKASQILTGATNILGAVQTVVPVTASVITPVLTAADQLQEDLKALQRIAGLAKITTLKGDQ